MNLGLNELLSRRLSPSPPISRPEGYKYMEVRLTPKSFPPIFNFIFWVHLSILGKIIRFRIILPTAQQMFTVIHKAKIFETRIVRKRKKYIFFKFTFWTISNDLKGRHHRSYRLFWVISFDCITCKWYDMIWYITTDTKFEIITRKKCQEFYFRIRTVLA